MSDRDPRGSGSGQRGASAQPRHGSAADPRQSAHGGSRDERPPAAPSSPARDPRPADEPTARFGANPNSGRPPAAGRDAPADPYLDLDDLGALDDFDDPGDYAGGTAFGRQSAPSGRRVIRDAEPDDPFDADAWALTGEWDDALDADAVDVSLEEPPFQPAAAPRSRRPAASRPRRAAERRPRPAPGLPPVKMPAFVSQADMATDRSALGLLAVALLSLLLMAVVLGSQLGRLANPAVLHLDAAGIPDRWGPPTVFWRIPLLAGMVTLINLVLAWFLAPRDRFLARFVLAASLVVQLLAWVAVVKIIVG